MALLVIAPVWLTLVLLVVAACQVAAEPEKIPSAAKPGGRDRLGETPAAALTEAGARLRAQPPSRRRPAGAGMQPLGSVRSLRARDSACLPRP